MHRKHQKILVAGRFQCHLPHDGRGRQHQGISPFYGHSQATRSFCGELATKCAFPNTTYLHVFACNCKVSAFGRLRETKVEYTFSWKKTQCRVERSYTVSSFCSLFLVVINLRSDLAWNVTKDLHMNSSQVGNSVPSTLPEICKLLKAASWTWASIP